MFKLIIIKKKMKYIVKKYNELRRLKYLNLLYIIMLHLFLYSGYLVLSLLMFNFNLK